jgi:O-methyltransferase
MYYDEEDLAREALKIVDGSTMCSYERMVTLWQQVRHLDRSGIEGCLVECGTWRGGAVGMMALAHMHSGRPTRLIHLFDSFEGLPEPKAENDGRIAIDYADNRAAGTLKSIGRCVGPLEDNRRLLGEVIGYPETLTHYHIGWFQHTVPDAAEKVGRIALLRLDGDWYESTKICIEAFGPKVSSGGIVVIDDYGKFPGCRKAVDEFLACTGRPVFLNHIDPTGRYYCVP